MKDQSILDEPQREAARVLVAKNRLSLPGTGTGRNEACMALLLHAGDHLAGAEPWLPDAPPRRLLPLHY